MPISPEILLSPLFFLITVAIFPPIIKLRDRHEIILLKNELKVISVTKTIPIGKITVTMASKYNHQFKLPVLRYNNKSNLFILISNYLLLNTLLIPTYFILLFLSKVTPWYL